MPVRVKQRSLALETRGGLERQWSDLRYSLVALMIASGRAVSLRVKDVATSRTLTLLEPKSQSELLRNPNTTRPSQSGRMQMALSVLGYAGLLAPSDMSSWIPASASSKTTVVNGAISLQPAPTKSIQFLSFGIHPLPRAAHNELYDHINRLFAKSRFGVMEEELVPEEEKRRRLKDKRFKQDGLTNKQKMVEKGVDRWPMFVLNIALKNKASSSSATSITRSDAALTAVVDILDALITGWLTSHHFSIEGKKRKDRGGLQAWSASDGETSDFENAPAQEPLSKQPSRSSTTLDTMGATARRETRDSPRRPYTGIMSFNELSRIKSAKPDILVSHKHSHISAGRPFTAPSTKPTSPVPKCRPTNRSSSPFVRVDPLLPGHLSASLRPKSRLATFVEPISGDGDVLEDSRPMRDANVLVHDETMDWMDPFTKKTHNVNARTGAAIVPKRIQEVANKDGKRQNNLERRVSLKMSKLVRPEGKESCGWLGNVLQEWNNPVFRTGEKSIPQVSLALPAAGISENCSAHSRTAEIDKSFTKISKMNGTKLSKSALGEAQVIAQVDNKFILVTMAASTDTITDEFKKHTIMVAIDQHAADERCKVEDLLTNLCTTRGEEDDIQTNAFEHNSIVKTSALSPPLKFSIAEREAELFRAHAARFAYWGILFTFGTLGAGTESSTNTELIIHALPPVIAERCKSEPKVLITLLRTELWKQAESSTMRCTNTSVDNDNEYPAKHPWLGRIGNCPQGILDMVNSRACRSAIMFNDTLSLQECKDLVHRLASCAFPFQCAHGRPSMVPLIDLGELSGITTDARDGFGLGNTDLGEEIGRESFGQAFVKWQHAKYIA
jgi:DNA mismatch repair protein MLH3